MSDNREKFPSTGFGPVWLCLLSTDQGKCRCSFAEDCNRQHMLPFDATVNWSSNDHYASCLFFFIAGLFNLRGSDIDYNPVFFAYAIISVNDVQWVILQRYHTFKSSLNSCSLVSLHLISVNCQFVYDAASKFPVWNYSRGVHNILLVRVYDAHIGGFLAVKFSKQGYHFHQISHIRGWLIG